MPRALLACFTIVAAFQLHLAAAPAVVEEAPVEASVAALASRFAIDPQRAPTRFMGDMARALYALYESRPPDFSGRPVARPRAPGEAAISVPVPLPLATWSNAVFKRTVPSGQLLATIFSDRRATLLCRGLSGLDDETLTYLIEHPSILTMLYERGPGVFGAFGQALHIHDGQVVTPGGAEFAPLWQAIVGESPSRPDRFVRLLFSEYDGRLAYLLDAVDTAPPLAAQFALGASLPPAERVVRFKALFAQLRSSYQEWHPEQHPFARPLGDLGMLLLRLRLTESGALAPPASRAFWQRVLDTKGDSSLESPTVDAAWLISATGGDDMYTRLERLDQIAFAQRVFPTAAVDPETAAQVVRPLRRYKMLPLTLERMGIRTPAVYAAAVQRAESLSGLGDDRRFWTISQFQGSVALLSRMRRSGQIDPAQAESLVRSLVALPPANGYGTSMARWWREQVDPILPPGHSWEARVLAALAGPAREPERRLFWEGQMYRIDLPHAETMRLTAVRDKQGGPTLDIAMTFAEISDALRAGTLSLADVRAEQQRLETLIVESGPRLRAPSVILPPPGVPVPRDTLVAVNDAVQRLRRVTRPGDLRRAADVGGSLEQLAGIVLGHVLVSLTYAADLGDPAGAAMLAGNVALRHDFGFNRKDSEGRMRMLWAQPRQEFQPGVPWHVAGSILSLEIGLAPLALQRQSIDRIADVPKLSSIEREALAVNVALLDPFRLTDASRDAIAQATDKGRARVSAAATPAAVAVLSDELGLDGYRRRAIAYAMAMAPQTLINQFTAVDLFMLGGGQPADLNAWGTPALQSFGCACSALTPSSAWYVLDGRLQLPLMAATMGDLNLTMGLMLRELDVPTVLLKSVLTYGMQELMDGLGDRGDWWGIAEAAAALSRHRVEDYVSAAAAVDGPLVPLDIDDDTTSSAPAH